MLTAEINESNPMAEAGFSGSVANGQGLIGEGDTLI
jgi:hypothetical protein